MADVMTFPETVEEFMEQYKITDTEHIYTNGMELVPIFRMKQWFEHLPSAEPERKTGRWIKDSDGVIICSECEEVASQRLFLITDDMRYEVRMNESNYCPNCGKRMVGESE